MYTGRQKLIYSTLIYDYQTKPVYIITNHQQVDIYKCSFIKCGHEMRDGGAVSITSQISHTTIQDSLFSSCIAANGGALYLISMSTIVSHCCFQECFAKSKSNAISSITTAPVFSNVASFNIIYQCNNGNEVVTLFNGKQEISHTNLSNCITSELSGASFMHSKISICKFSLLEKLNGNFALLYHYTKGSTIYFCSFFQNQVNTALFSYDSVHVCDIEMCKLFQNKGDMLRHVNVTKINIIDFIGDYPHKSVSCNDYIHGSNDCIICYNYAYLPNQQQNLTIPLEFDHLYCDHTKIETALRVYITNKHVSWVGFTLFFFVGIKTYLSLRKRRIEQAEENHRRVTQERMEEEALSITEGLEFEHEEEEEQNNNPGQNN